jgi:hypothetical protein
MRLLTQLLLVQPNHLYIQLLDGLYELLILQQYAPGQLATAA